MSDLLKAFVEELENINEADLATKEQAREGLITGFKEKADSNISFRRLNYENLINAGIHPNILYEKPKWTWKDGNTEKYIRLEDISEDLDNVFVSNWEWKYDNDKKDWFFSMNRDSDKKPILEILSTDKFLEIIKDPINKNIYNSIMKNESEDPDDWLEEYNWASEKEKNNFLDWYNINNKALELDKYEIASVINAYFLMKNGHLPIEKALERRAKLLKDNNLKESEDILTTRGKDSKIAIKVLQNLGINPRYISRPFYDRNELPDTNDPDDIELDTQYIIWAIGKDGNTYDTIYLKEYNKMDPISDERFIPEKNLRAKPYSVDTVKDMIAEYEKTEFTDKGEEYHPNPKDNMNSLAHQRSTGRVGTHGSMTELTSEQVRKVLKLMQNEKEFKGEDLVHIFDHGKYGEINKRIVLALKLFEPDKKLTIRAMPNKNGYNGIKYYIFIPDEDSDNPYIPVHGSSNPWKKFMKG